MTNCSGNTPRGHQYAFAPYGSAAAAGFTTRVALVRHGMRGQAGFPWINFPEAIKTAHFVHINGCHGPHEVRLGVVSGFVVWGALFAVLFWLVAP